VGRPLPRCTEAPDSRVAGFERRADARIGGEQAFDLLTERLITTARCCKERRTIRRRQARCAIE